VRVLRRIVGPKRDELCDVGENCIMRSFITCTLRPSIIRMIKSRRMRCAGYVASMEEKRNLYGILVAKLEGKRLLGRPRRGGI
jgi:hypothetical protein